MIFFSGYFGQAYFAGAQWPRTETQESVLSVLFATVSVPMTGIRDTPFEQFTDPTGH